MKTQPLAEMNYWLQFEDGRVRGPFAVSQVRGFYERGEVTVATPVCADDGGEAWGTVADLQAELEGRPAAPATAPVDRTLAEEMGAVPATSRTQKASPAAKGPSDCQRGVYILLALFLGGLGIHNFYADRTSEGVGEIVMLFAAAFFWAIGVTVDATGIALVGWAFAFVLLLMILLEIACVKVDGKGRTMR